MFLVVWLSVGLLLFVAGMIVQQPRWLMNMIRPKYYCKTCAEDLTKHDRWRIKQAYEGAVAFEAREG